MEVLGQLDQSPFSIRRLALPKDIRRMVGDEDLGLVGLEQPASIGSDRHVLPDETQRRGRPESHDHSGTQQLDLLGEPGFADLDLVSVGALVQTTLAAGRTPLEVFDRVGLVGVTRSNPGALQGLIEDATCGSHEGLALKVFFVPRLFSHQHDLRLRRPFPEHGLRRPLVQMAGRTIGRRGSHDTKTARVGHLGVRDLGGVSSSGHDPGLR